MDGKGGGKGDDRDAEQNKVNADDDDDNDEEEDDKDGGEDDKQPVVIFQKEKQAAKQKKGWKCSCIKKRHTNCKNNPLYPFNKELVTCGLYVYVCVMSLRICRVCVCVIPCLYTWCCYMLVSYS